MKNEKYDINAFFCPNESKQQLIGVSESLQQEWINDWLINEGYQKYFKSHFDFISFKTKMEGAKYLCEYWDENNQTDTEIYVYNALVMKYGKKPIVQKAFYCSNNKTYWLDLCYENQVFNQKFYIAIEVDGNEHDAIRDRIRNFQLLRDHNVHTIRFTNMDIYKSKNNDGLLLQTIINQIDTFTLEKIKFYLSQKSNCLH